RREGVTVELRDTPGVRTPEARGSAVLPFDLELLREVLLELSGYGRRWPYLGRVDVLWRQPQSALLYCKTRLSWPLSDRDWVMRMDWRADQTHFYLNWYSIPGVMPTTNGVIRLYDHSGHWVLTRRGPKATHVVYYRRGDFGGLL